MVVTDRDGPGAETEEITVRYMLLLSYDEAAQGGRPPAPGEFEAMGGFNEAMVDAGVLLAGEGLTPSKDGVRLTFPEGPHATDREEPTVTDGPFTEAKELVGGFWILEVASKEEALTWARRAPLGHGSTLEVRRVFEASDFEGVAPAEVMEAEATLRQRIAERDGA